MEAAEATRRRRAAAKKTAAQAAQAREAQQHAREATANANQAQAAAKEAQGPEADKLQVKAQEATTKAVEARNQAKKELEQFKHVAAEAQKLSQAVNDAAVKAGEKPVFNDVKGFDALKDTFEDASTVKNGADFQAKFGADRGTDMQELTRARQGDFVSDAQLDEIAGRVKVENPANGRDSDASRVEASKQLKAELQNLPPASRERLLERMRPTLEEISKGANGTPDEGDRKEILRNLADVATLSGPDGAKVVSQSFSNVATNEHTDVDNGDQLGGALKDIIKEDPQRAAFGFTLGNEMKAKGGQPGGHPLPGPAQGARRRLRGRHEGGGKERRGHRQRGAQPQGHRQRRGELRPDAHPGHRAGRGARAPGPQRHRRRWREGERRHRGAPEAVGQPA